MAILFLMLLASCATTFREIEIRLTSAEAYGAKDIFAHIDDYSGHPSGTSSRIVDYQWQLFAGHGVERIQVHFFGLSLSDSSSLTILDANGEELQRLDANSPNSLWSNEFAANLLVFHLQSNLAAGNGRDRFTVDRVRTWTSVSQWFQNHPTGTLTGGAFPNIPELQPNNQRDPQSRKRLNREVWGVLAGSDAHYYTAAGLEHNFFDFATITLPSGPPAERDELRDTFYRTLDRTMVSGHFGGDDRSDVAVLTNQNEVFVSVSDRGSDGRQGFRSFHIAHRNFPSLGRIFSGRVNADVWDDLLAAWQDPDSYQTFVTYAVNDANAAYPQFSATNTVELVWSGDAPYNYFSYPNFLPGDFNGDGFVDVAIPINLGAEGIGEWAVDHFQIFISDHNGGFRGHRVHGYLGLNDAPSNHQRLMLVGNFDGDRHSDLLLADFPNISGSEALATQALTLYVLVNSLTTRQLPQSGTGYNVFAAPAVWSTLPLRSTTAGREVVRRIEVADVNGDGRDDIVAFLGVKCVGCTSMPEPSQIRVALSIHPAGSTPRFGAWQDWSPPLAAMKLPDVSALMAVGRFADSGNAETFVTQTDRSPQVELLRMDHGPFTNKLGFTTTRFLGYTHRLVGSMPQYAFGDVDGDGRKDIVIFTGDERGTVEVLLNRSATVQPSYAFNRFQRSGRAWIADFAKDFRPGKEYPLVADVDGDGYADLVLVSGDAPTFAADGDFFPFGIFVALNKRDGAFAPPVRWNSILALGVGSGNRVPLVADFDGDGRADLAIISKLNSAYAYVARSRGDRFGANASSYDFVFSTGIGINSTHQYTFATNDINGDGRADIIVTNMWLDGARTHGNVYSVRFGQGDSHSTQHETSLNLLGAPTVNHITLGKFSPDSYSDIAFYVSQAERVQYGDAAIQVYFTKDETEWMPFPIKGYRQAGPANDRYIRIGAFDIDNDKREELVLIRPGLSSSNVRAPLEVQAISMAYYDVNVHARPQPSSLSNGLPHDGWTLGSAHVGTGEELTWNRASPDGRFAIRVENRVNEPVFYKLISNQILIKDHTLDVLWMKKESDITTKERIQADAIFKDGARRLFDATDGYYRLNRIQYWVSDEFGEFENDCDLRVDIHLFDRPGRANAVPGCRIELFLGDGVDRETGKKASSDSGSTLVHEYGHYIFRMADEYCEQDGGSSGLGPRACPFQLSGPSDQVLVQGMCPPSLMAKSSQTEFCTFLLHRPFGVTGQISPAWTNVSMCPPGMCQFPADIGPARPETTPNPHQYLEPMFNHFLQVCAGDSNDCLVP
jgi:hypothetical protein